MNNTSSPDDLLAEDDLLPEYDFDYRQARPNRFAAPLEDGSLVVVLAPDIAKVFTTPESVTQVLRALIATMPNVADRPADLLVDGDST
jgi:hypothetical protein